MKPPLCKLCKTRHWLAEPHVLSADISYSYAGEMYGAPVHETEVWHIGLVLEPEGLVVVDATKDLPLANVTPEPNVTNVTSKRNGGRAKVYATPAEKQAAYRTRRKG